MANRTVDELQDTIDDSFQWRRSELVSLKDEVEKLSASAADPPRNRMIIRAAVVLLYAHWEGFVRDSCQAYLEYLANIRLTYSEMSEPLARGSLARLAHKLKQGDDETINHLVEALCSTVPKRSHIPKKDEVLEKTANLRYQQVVKMFDRLGLASGQLEPKAQLIDYQLCNKRNDIAHGKGNFPSKDSVLRLHLDVITMMHDVRSIITNTALEGSYKREPTETG